MQFFTHSKPLPHQNPLPTPLHTLSWGRLFILSCSGCKFGWIPPDICRSLKSYFLFQFFSFPLIYQLPNLDLGISKLISKLSPLGWGLYPIPREWTFLSYHPTFIIWCSCHQFCVRLHIVSHLASVEVIPVSTHHKNTLPHNSHMKLEFLPPSRSWPPTPKWQQLSPICWCCPQSNIPCSNTIAWFRKLQFISWKF